MAVDIFKLVGSIFIDTDKANESLQKTDKKASSFAQTLGTAAKGAVAVGTAMVSAGIAVGGAALKVADDVSAQADEIDKASIRMGIGVEAYQEYAYAAGQCGVEVSTLEAAAKKLEGTDINFDDAIASIMELGTAEERSAKAAELFGDKIAYNLSPLIEQSGEDFDSLIQRSHDLGIVMSEDAVKNGVQFGDLLSDLKQSIGSLATSLGSALMPIMIDVVNQLLEFMPQIQGFMGQIAPILADVVASILPILFEILQAMLPVLIEIIQTILPLLIDVINSLLPLVQALLPLLAPITNLLMAILVPLVQFLDAVLPPLINSLTNIINGVMPALIAVIGLVAEGAKSYIQMVLDFVQPFIDNIIDLFDGLATFFTGVFTGNWEMAWEGILKIMKTYVNGIIRALEAFINLFVDSINTIIQGAMRLANLVPGVDLDTSVSLIPKVNIPKLAKGGVITEEGQAIVGEKGAELLTLPKGASVTPLNNNDFDYDRLANSIVNAMRNAGFGKMTVPVYVGNDFLEAKVVDALNTSYYRSGGR